LLSFQQEQFLRGRSRLYLSDPHLKIMVNRQQSIVKSPVQGGREGQPVADGVVFEFAEGLDVGGVVFLFSRVRQNHFVTFFVTFL
jgi:hypothetical protein